MEVLIIRFVSLVIVRRASFGLSTICKGGLDYDSEDYYYHYYYYYYYYFEGALNGRQTYE